MDFLFSWIFLIHVLSGGDDAIIFLPLICIWIPARSCPAVYGPWFGRLIERRYQKPERHLDHGSHSCCFFLPSVCFLEIPSTRAATGKGRTVIEEEGYLEHCDTGKRGRGAKRAFNVFLFLVQKSFPAFRWSVGLVGLSPSRVRFRESRRRELLYVKPYSVTSAYAKHNLPTNPPKKKRS